MRHLIAGGCLALIAAATVAGASEPLILPEELIIGEDRSGETLPPLAEPPLPAMPRPLMRLAAPPLADDPRHPAYLGLGIGTRDHFSLFFRRDFRAGQLFLEASRYRRKPFPRAATELGVTGVLARSFSFCHAEFSLSAGYHRDLPAAAGPGDARRPDSFPATPSLAAGATVTFLPLGTTRPTLGVSHRFFPDRRRDGRFLLAPGLAAELAVVNTALPRTSFRAFLEYSQALDYGAARRSPALFLPGVTVNRQLAERHFLAFTVKNAAGRKYEILPGAFGPGTTASLHYSVYF